MTVQTEMTRTEIIQMAEELAAEVRARAAQADADGELPAEDVAALAKKRYPGLAVPESYGGRGASLKTCVEAQLALAQGSASTALVAAMTLHIVGHEVEVESWAPRARETIFLDVARGALLNSAASEPRLGSPSRGGLPDTYAERSGDMLVVNGHKNWVTGGEHLRHLLVRLRLGDEAVVVWLPGDTPGLRWEKIWGDGLSLRASDSHDLYLADVRVPAANIIQRGKSPANVWFPMLMAATYLGSALAARGDIVRYALDRVPTALGKPIATLPGIQRQIGDIDISLQAAQTFLVATAAAWRGDEDERADFLVRAASAKHVAVETALNVTDKALRVAGAAGIDKGLALERYFRDVRGGLMHPPSGDAALELVGRRALSL
ncbi:acyl-CoA dehydrogenase family protein [soil metagenome]